MVNISPMGVGDRLLGRIKNPICGCSRGGADGVVLTSDIHRRLSSDKGGEGQNWARTDRMVRRLNYRFNETRT